METKEKIKAVRAKTGLNQRAFASMIGVSESLYSKAEAGIVGASEDLIESIITRFGINKGFFHGKESLKEFTMPEALAVDKKGSYIDELIASLKQQVAEAKKEALEWKQEMVDWKKQAQNLSQAMTMGKLKALEYAGVYGMSPKASSGARGN